VRLKLAVIFAAVHEGV